MTRLAVAGGIVAAAVLAGLVLFGGSGGYAVTATFQNAGQLVEGNQVQVGGRAVGLVTGIELSRDGRAVIEMRLEDEVAPLHQGTVAVIRASSLSGIANRYVSLAPGPNDAPEIADGGRIAADDGTAPVDLDQLFNTLDGRTRRALQRVVQGSAAQYAGKGPLANEALGFLNPALSTSSRLTRELVRDEQAFERFIVDTSRVVTALSERRAELAQLVGNANVTTRAIGDESVALERALALLPGTLRKANTTFANLRVALDDLDALVAASKPATRDLAPFLRKLRPLIAEARPTIADLRGLIRARGRNNDLIELTSKMPRLADLASSVFPRSVSALRRSQPVLEYVRPYAPELTGWFTKFAQGANAYDANGHYARIQPIFNAFSPTDTPAGQVLTAAPGSQRLAGFETRRGNRCPGGATQPPPDGSAPFRDSDGRLDCDPATVPPGP